MEPAKRRKRRGKETGNRAKGMGDQPEGGDDRTCSARLKKGILEAIKERRFIAAAGSPGEESLNAGETARSRGQNKRARGAPPTPEQPPRRGQGGSMNS